MMLAAAIAAQALPVLGVAPTPRWPHRYHCRVVTDATEVLEFSLHLQGKEMTLDRDVLSISGNAKIALEQSGPGLKSGNSYLRALRSVDLPEGRAWITQTGTMADPSTQMFIDLGSAEQPAAKRRGQASGYCAVNVAQDAKDMSE